MDTRCSETRRRWNRGLAWLALSLALSLAFPHAATAHAIVIASEPASGAVVTGPDLQLHIRFNSRIDHERSKLVVVSDDGRSFPVELQAGAAEDVLDGRVMGVPAGPYRLRWIVLAIDGHITRGDIPFAVTVP